VSSVTLQEKAEGISQIIIPGLNEMPNQNEQRDDTHSTAKRRANASNGLQFAMMH
jgi:hypothetical protein